MLKERTQANLWAIKEPKIKRKRPRSTLGIREELQERQ
jgi:hypothetical protein